MSRNNGGSGGTSQILAGKVMACYPRFAYISLHTNSDPVYLFQYFILSNLSKIEDAYSRYIQSPPEPNINSPFSYWLNSAKSTNQLPPMALDIFSIPAMSADPERLFSSSKHILKYT